MALGAPDSTLCRMRISNKQAAPMRRKLRGGCAVIAAAVLLACGCSKPEPPAAFDRYRVGAYYYNWFPGKFSGRAYLRARLRPAQVPELGAYSSEDPAVIERHIAWCSQYGIDFLAISWWPSGANQRPSFYDKLLEARNIGDISFCVFYETWSLGFNSETGSTRLDEKAESVFLADMRQFADTLFSHPSYLKIGGRPVVILYLTRTLEGGYAQAIEKCRSALKSMGWDVFLIADEIFWSVVPADKAPEEGARSTDEPQPERIRLFDAITAYNLYDFSRTNHAGYGAQSDFIREAAGLFERYRNAIGPGAAFVPSVIPGYNDRGVRFRRDHYAIPRQWSPGSADGSFLGEAIERLAMPFMDPNLQMAIVTSWNEWNEDTAIEPLAAAPPTSLDESDSGREFTQGHAYAGAGTLYLETLRDRFCAVAGRVTRAGSAPAAGVPVLALRGGTPVARDTTDKAGYFTLSRLRLPPGQYTVVAGNARAEANVTRERTALVALELPAP